MLKKQGAKGGTLRHTTIDFIDPDMTVSLKPTDVTGCEDVA